MKINIILFFSLLIFLGGCSEYQKVLKSSDINLKYDKALEYYGEKEYYKAYPLFEELIAIYRGTEKAENLMYMYAYSDYYLKDYILAAHRFSQFVKTFPVSERAEECQFMVGLCNYKNSPKASLDQTNTVIAINELQLFTNLYPNSELVDSCNVIIDELLEKLAKKRFEKANLYLQTENYKSAIIAYKNFLDDFPDTEYREESEFLIFKSSHFLALNSVESKKSERIDNAIKAYITFVDSFSGSKYLKKAEDYYQEVLIEKQKQEEKNS